MPISSPLTLPVSELNLFIRDWIDSCPPLNDIWVIGEIGNYRRQAGAQRYFTLSEGESTIQCVIFDGLDPRFEGPYKDGVQILARGKVRYFNRRGSLQFQINYMMPKGAGSIALNLEQLKQKLTLEGLFNPEKKRPIPTLPSNVAVITAPDSAASADIVRLLAQHAPQINMVIIETIMQGMGCPGSVCAALDAAEKLPNVDIILIARGGGSAEDLLPFSDERLVRRISGTTPPVITAIGHEIDSTLSDLAADATFPTPSAAALAITYAYQQLPLRIEQCIQSATKKIDALNQALFGEMQDCRNRATQEIDRVQMTTVDQFQSKLRELTLLSPLRKLAQGFSISRDQNGTVIRSVSQVKIGDLVAITYSDGVVTTAVLDQ